MLRRTHTHARSICRDPISARQSDMYSTLFTPAVLSAPPSELFADYGDEEPDAEQQLPIDGGGAVAYDFERAVQASAAQCRLYNNQTESSDSGGDSPFDGGSAACASELFDALYCFHNLASHADQPSESETVSTGPIASLSELYSACVEDIHTQTTARKLALFQRVHAMLDWDEQRDLVRLLNSVERVASSESGDCYRFRRRQLSFGGRRITVQRFLYKLCCRDDKFDGLPRAFRLRCLCGANSDCINPQHYVHEARRDVFAAAQKRKRFESSSSLPLAASAVAKSDEQLTPDDLTAMALAACLADRDELERRNGGGVEDNVGPFALRQEKEQYRDSGDGTRTPALDWCSSACPTPVSGGAQRRDKSVQFQLAPPRPKPPARPPPSPAAIADQCRVSAAALGLPMMQWHKSYVIQ